MSFIWAMKIDRATLEKIAGLAQLEFGPEEERQIMKDLEEILGFVEKLKEVDTGQTGEINHVSEKSNAFRPDDTGEVMSRDDALKNAPDHDGTFFRVPKVIQK